jgi:hypothetical protein
MTSPTALASALGAVAAGAAMGEASTQQSGSRGGFGDLLNGSLRIVGEPEVMAGQVLLAFTAADALCGPVVT